MANPQTATAAAVFARECREIFDALISAGFNGEQATELLEATIRRQKVITEVTSNG